MTHQEQLLAAAKAEDTYNLLNHIAWTDVIRPRLQGQVEIYSRMLVNEALGSPLPPGRTREQIAGMAFGINEICKLFEQILRDGERALAALNDVPPMTLVARGDSEGRI